MKKIILLMLIFSISLFSANDNIYLNDIFYIKKKYWEPVYVKNMELTKVHTLQFLGDDYIDNQTQLGYSYFRGLEVKSYIGKDLGFMIDDLSNKFNLIEFTFSNYQEKDSSSEEVIYLYFKNCDNFILEVDIIVESDPILKSLKLNRTLNDLKKIKRYFAWFAKVDLLKFYCQRKDIDSNFRKFNESKQALFLDSISKASYEKIINAGIDYKCE